MENTNLVNPAQNIRKKRMPALRVVFILCFTLVPLLHFLVFYVYVNLDSFLMAFQLPKDGELTFVGFENFKWVFEKITQGSTNPEDNLGLAFINTFKTFGIAIIMFPIGMFVSYFIYKKIWGYSTFRVLFYLPHIISPVVVSFFYQALMGSEFFTNMLESLYGLEYDMSSALVDSDFANRMVFLHFVWLNFPGSIIIWGGTFSRIPDSLIESAQLDGINWVQEMFLIILPLVWPTFVLMITMQLAGIFGASGAVFLLTGGLNGTQTVSNWMYVKVYQATNPLVSGSLYKVSAMGLMLTVVSCAIALFVRKVINSRVEETQY